MAKDGQGYYKLLSCCLWAAMLLAPLASSGPMKTVSRNRNLKTFNEWKCSKPQPRVIHIENLDEYFAPNMIYLPSALVVHRCDQSTGCCNVPGEVCKSVESAEEKIQFAVDVMAIGKSGIGANPGNRGLTRERKTKAIKKLVVTLTNHTRCGCVGKIDLRA